MKGIKFNLFILAIAILMVVSISVLHWTTYQSGMREGKIAQEELLSELDVDFEKLFPRLIMSSPPTDEALILSYKKAIELKQEFPIVGYTFISRNMMWPLSQSFAIDSFIEWLYLNDYEIVIKEAK